MKSLIVLSSIGAAMAGASSYPTSSTAASGMPAVATPTTTYTYGTSCAPAPSDETVTRAAESTPCPSCPVFSVSYSAGATTPGAQMPTMAAPSPAVGAAAHIGATGSLSLALGLVAYAFAGVF